MRVTGICAAVFVLAVSLGAASDGVCAGEGYVVTLNDGKSVTANTCRVEGGKLYLGYPVGSAVIDARRVARVDRISNSSDFLQSKGTRVKDDPAKTSGNAATATLSAPLYANPAPPAQKTPPYATRQASIPDDPKAQEIDRFIEAYFNATDTQRELIDSDMDRITAAFFDEPPEDDGWRREVPVDDEDWLIN